MTSAASLLLFFILPASAQSQPAGAPAREKPKAESKADPKAEPKTEPDVAYEQVLQNPDNADLNLRYAQQQVKKGELKGAAATLERILLTNPNLASVRLFYAIVLFRLDNLVEAEREFKTLKELNLSPALKQEIDDYAAAIAKRRKKHRFSGRLAMGQEYDSNRNAAPSSGQRLFADSPVTMTGAGLKRDDSAWLFLGSVDTRHDPGFQLGHEVFGSLSFYKSEQNDVKGLNIQALSFNTGVELKSNYGHLSPSFLYDYVDLAQTTYLRNVGMGLRYDKVFRRRTRFFIDMRDVYERYSRTAEAPTGDERSGANLELQLGADYLLLANMKIGASYTIAMKSAARKYNAYDRNGLGLSAYWLPGKGTFLMSSLTFNADKYDASDPAVSRAVREDKSLRLSFTGGVPLGLAHRSLKDLVLSMTYEHYKSDSNLRNYEYKNNRLATLLTYKWEGGL